MDADPGQQWSLLILAVILLVVAFCFALYEQALRATTTQSLENMSAAFSVNKQEKVASLVKNLPREYQLAHYARLTNCLVAWLLVVTSVLSSLSGSLTNFIVGPIVFGLVISLIDDPLFVKLPLKLVDSAATKRALKGYLYGHWTVVLFVPLVFITDWLGSVLGKNKAAPVAPTQVMSWQSIVDMIEEGRSKGEIDNDEYEMIEGILSLHEKMAREVMVPRIDAFMIDINNDNDRSIDDILQMNYSRVPVYHEDKDDIIGVVHIKNLVKTARRFGFEHTTIRQVMQEPFFVPETIMIDQLIYEMKKKQNQMAILLDQYGGVVGIVTLEDLIEEIVGEIEDELDEPDQMVFSLTPADFLVQGRMALDDFNDEFGIDLQNSDADTIAGFMITQLGYIPEETNVDSVELDDGTKLVVHKMDGDRLLQIEVELSHAAVDYRVAREKSQKKAQEKLELNQENK